MNNNFYRIDVTKLPWKAEEINIENKDILDELNEEGVSSEQDSGYYYIKAASGEEALKIFESLDIETLEQTGIDEGEDPDSEEDGKENVHNI